MMDAVKVELGDTINKRIVSVVYRYLQIVVEDGVTVILALVQSVMRHWSDFKPFECSKPRSGKCQPDGQRRPRCVALPYY